MLSLLSEHEIQNSIVTIAVHIIDKKRFLIIAVIYFFSLNKKLMALYYHPQSR